MNPWKAEHGGGVNDLGYHKIKVFLDCSLDVFNARISIKSLHWLVVVLLDLWRWVPWIPAVNLAHEAPSSSQRARGNKRLIIISLSSCKVLIETYRVSHQNCSLFVWPLQRGHIIHCLGSKRQRGSDLFREWVWNHITGCLQKIVRSLIKYWKITITKTDSWEDNPAPKIMK